MTNTAISPDTTRPPTPPDPAPFTEPWWYLFSEVACLRETIDASSPEGRELHACATHATRADVDLTDDNPPTAAELRAVTATFHALPTDVRRALMRGWGLDRWPTWEKAPREMGWSSALVIEPGHRFRDGSPIFAHELVRTDTTHPVQVNIRIGTPLDVVRRALRDLHRLIADHWPAMILDDHERSIPAVPTVSLPAAPSRYHFERLNGGGLRCLHCGKTYRKPGDHIRGHLKRVHGIELPGLGVIVAPAPADAPRNAT